MSVPYEDERADSDLASVTLVDPRAPRFGQAITATGLLAGVTLDRPAFVFAIAAMLGLAVFSGWRLDVYGTLWRRVVRLIVGPSGSPEPAPPHRFAKLLGATGSVGASVLLVAGFPLAGYGLAAGVGLAAGLAATTGICLGCRMYQQVSFFRQLGVV